MHDHFCSNILSVLLYCINVESQICFLFKSFLISTLELFSLKDTEGELCQKMDMSEIAQKILNQSMPHAYSVILKYKETQEAESIGRLTIIVGGWVRNT